MRFENLNTKKIAEYINNASKRIVYLAPAIHCDVSIALKNAYEKHLDITIIIDSNPDVERFGYGNIESLRTLNLSNIEIRKCKGIRIGFLSVDDINFVYAPIPTILEEEPSNNKFPNAIFLTELEALDILNSILPNEKNEVELALGIVEKKEIDNAIKDIEERPPLKPELARRITILNSYFQIVDVEFKGSKLKQNSIHVGPEILGIKNIELAKRFNIKFSLFRDVNIIELEEIKRKFESLKKDLLISVPKVGNIIFYKDRAAFDIGINEIKSDLKNVFKEIIDDIKALILEDKSELKEIIVQNIKDLDIKYKRQILHPKEPTDKNIIKYVDWKIDKMFKNPTDYLDNMELIYKVYNVSDQLIDDKDFRESIEKHFGKPIDKIITTEIAVRAEELQNNLFN